jgi:hypothetical protein
MKHMTDDSDKRRLKPGKVSKITWSLTAIGIALTAWVAFDTPEGPLESIPGRVEHWSVGRNGDFYVNVRLSNGASALTSSIGLVDVGMPVTCKTFRRKFSHAIEYRCNLLQGRTSITPSQHSSP